MDDWKDKFLELYTTNDFKAAFNLKKEHFPSKLYRYRPALKHTLDEIATGEIYLAPHKELNDPFEGVSIMKEDEFHCRNDIKNLNDIMTQLSHNMKRIACFTNTEKNEAMWSKYANQSSGVCLEYDTETFEENIIDSFFPVFYTDERFDFINYVITKMEYTKQGIERLGNLLWLYKSQFWSYEKEWRIIFHVDEKSPDEYREKGMKLKLKQPSRVLLGTKINKNNEKNVREVCDKYTIPVVKM